MSKTNLNSFASKVCPTFSTHPNALRFSIWLKDGTGYMSDVVIIYPFQMVPVLKTETKPGLELCFDVQKTIFPMSPKLLDFDTSRSQSSARPHLYRVVSHRSVSWLS